MSMKSGIRRLAARSGLAVGDFEALQRDVSALVARSEPAVGPTVGDLEALQRDVTALVALVESSVALLREVHAGLSSLSGVDVRREFDSIATAHAEAMVYVNRSLRDIRTEMLSISASMRRLEANPTIDNRE